MPTYLDTMAAALGEAMAPLGLRVALDPAAAVPPCLLVDYTPTPIKDTACGEVFVWEALLVPARTTAWLAAQWLAAHRKAVRDAIDGMPAAAVVEEEGVHTRAAGDDDPLSVPAYRITFQST